jgi:putative cardiolipin synthase
VNESALADLRKKIDASATTSESGRYAQALRSDDGIQRLASGDWPLQWSAKYRFVSDDPAKVTMDDRDAARASVGAALVPMIRNASQSLRIISPYFVPGDQGSAGLIERARAGTTVQVLTNSLAANDVASVHGGYSRHRQALIEGGVQVWELKPQGKTGEASLTGSSGASLHTKALTADGRVVFVGSYNLDPRSTWLNSEQGVLVEDARLAAELGAIFDHQTAGSRAWRVTLADGELQWADGTETLREEPLAKFSQKFQAWFARVFHLDAQL